MLSELAVVPCFLCQSAHGSSCPAEAPVELCSSERVSEIAEPR